jgi:hypothetical protein
VGKDPDQVLTGEREDTICCQCGEHVPNAQAMDHPRDPDAWVHIDCPAWVK